MSTLSSTPVSSTQGSLLFSHQIRQSNTNSSLGNWRVYADLTDLRAEKEWPLCGTDVLNCRLCRTEEFPQKIKNLWPTLQLKKFRNIRKLSKNASNKLKSTSFSSTSGFRLFPVATVRRIRLWVIAILNSALILVN